jgi:hypothetical protein
VHHNDGPEKQLHFIVHTERHQIVKNHLNCLHDSSHRVMTMSAATNILDEIVSFPDVAVIGSARNVACGKKLGTIAFGIMKRAHMRPEVNVDQISYKSPTSCTLLRESPETQAKHEERLPGLLNARSLRAL